MTQPDLGFLHEYHPDRGPLTLLLLHGTGGTERSMLNLGRELAPGANLLSPRGKVLEGTMARFFRRLAEGVFDVDDLFARSDEMAAFVGAAADAYGFDPRQVVAVGYSNGANMAGSLLLRHPGLLAGAVLLRPMVPFVPETAPDLMGTRVFVAAGRDDPLVPAEQADALASLLRGYGADVTLNWEESDHALTEAELDRARAWLAR